MIVIIIVIGEELLVRVFVLFSVFFLTISIVEIKFVESMVTLMVIIPPREPMVWDLAA
jgi:hypothetical protein